MVNFHLESLIRDNFGLESLIRQKFGSGPQFGFWCLPNVKTSLDCVKGMVSPGKLTWNFHGFQ